MRVRRGDHTDLEARAKAEPGPDVMTDDYYTQLPQIRLTPDDATGRAVIPQTPVEVTLDGNDVARLVECAIRHPTPNMRYGVLAAIWNHPDTFRQIFQFGLDAPAAFLEIREIVAEALAKHAPKAEFPTSNQVRPAGETLLPLMPLPAHLKDRERR